MDKYLYREIQVFKLFPFMAAKYNFACVLHQDNDALHLSGLCKAISMENNINWVKIFYLYLNNWKTIENYWKLFKFDAPPYSPDINPIEMVWNEMRNFVRTQFCETPYDVVSAV